MVKTPQEREVGIRELRDHLSSYLDEVAEGATLIVTDRGTPVARVEPIGDALAAYDRLVEQGLIIRAKEPATPAGGWRTVKAKGSVSDLVAEQRR